MMDCREDSTILGPRGNSSKASVECLVYNLSAANVRPDSQTELLPRLPTDTVADMFTRPVFYESDMRPFWDGYRQHLAALGITLCELRDAFWMLPGTAAVASLPFARRCLHQNTTVSEDCLLTRLGSAQDAQGRDLVIKLVDMGTMEHQIYDTLSKCKVLYSGHAFPCVLPPTAIVQSPHRFAFVAMPRWGSKFRFHQFRTAGQMMLFIRCTLAGLSFLHKHRIAHRDIHETNMLVNWYCRDERLGEDCLTRLLGEHYSSPDACYALFDFDLALQLPPDTCLRSCRRPAEEAFTGKRDYHPADVYQGEEEYNPFAFDVACLGNLFLTHFAEAIPTVPSLAPLLGGMTTHMIDDRFTAEEALAFACEVEAGLSSDVLCASVALKPDFGPLEDPELYWARVSPEFRALWRSYQPPPLSWTHRILNWLTTTTYTGSIIVMTIRRTLHI